MAATAETLINVDAQRTTTFTQLYAEHFHDLVGFCRRQLAGDADPEAVAQDAFERAWIAWEHYEQDRPFWPWIVTFARRLCIDHGRRTIRRAARSHLEAATLEPEPSVDLAIDLELERFVARNALTVLRPEQQRLIKLRDLNGLSYREIARMEGVTIDSVRGALKRARGALRVAFHRAIDDVGPSRVATPD